MSRGQISKTHTCGLQDNENEKCCANTNNQKKATKLPKSFGFGKMIKDENERNIVNAVNHHLVVSSCVVVVVVVVGVLLCLGKSRRVKSTALMPSLCMLTSSKACNKVARNTAPMDSAGVTASAISQSTLFSCTSVCPHFMQTNVPAIPKQ
jgi:hypothetical protein